jgi:hypothetical protein
MNERINELLKQSRTEYWTQYTPSYDYEKFAELIVQECYETIKKDMELAHIQLIPIDFGIYANGRLRRIIKEHLGVK